MGSGRTHRVSRLGRPLTDPAEIADVAAAYRDLGADEPVLYCYSDDVRQVDTLAGLLA